MRKEGQEEGGEEGRAGRKGGGRKRGRKRRRKGVGEICTGGLSHAHAHVITLRGAGALVAVGGAAGTSSYDGGGHSLPFGVVLGCLLCAIDAVAGDVVVGADHHWSIRICGQLVVIVGVQVCGWLVVIVYVCVHGQLVVVVYVCVPGWLWSLCMFMFTDGWWSLCMFMFVGGWWSL